MPDREGSGETPGAGKPAQDRARPPAAVLSSHLDDAGLDRRRHLVRAVAGA